MVQPDHQYLPLQQPLTGAHMSPNAQPPGQHAPSPHVLAEIASIANALCDDLADRQWLLAARIRSLAETPTVNGAT
ncbi:hypothetical protein ACFXEL_11180 [Streptomyces sp. NPDC059382]|uniref:hypothetical protein n=1 Tax=Streptomyces sp. NPDC059382 TaxID=3346816 RepID=UPI00367C2AB0